MYQYCKQCRADTPIILYMVLLRGVQFTFFQHFQQLYLLIHYCCDNIRKVRAPNAVRHLGVPHMYWPHLKKNLLRKNLFQS
jgi:hypothetical protein